jgi:hypothetical protein
VRKKVFLGRAWLVCWTLGNCQVGQFKLSGEHPHEWKPLGISPSTAQIQALWRLLGVVIEIPAPKSRDRWMAREG